MVQLELQKLNEQIVILSDLIQRHHEKGADLVKHYTHGYNIRVLVRTFAANAIKRDRHDFINNMI